MKRRSRCMRAVAFMLVLILFLADSSLGQRPTTLRVPHSYPSIQAAINTSRRGDTVLVDHGLYYENIRLNKNIVLASRFILDGDTAHIFQTIIDGSRPRDSLHASVVTIGPTDTTCVLMGFTIRGGLGTFHHAARGQYNWISGGGVFILNAGARVAHNRIIHNRLATRWKHNRTFGAGLASHDSTFGANPPPFLIIEHNVIAENVAEGLYGSSGGMEIGQPGIVRHNVVTDNRASSDGRSLGGGILVELQANYLVTLDGNYVCRNTASWGGGILIGCGTRRKGRAIVTNNIIARNKGFEIGGGVHILDNVHSLLIGNTIAENSALSQGGGLCVFSNTDVAVINNIIWNNRVDQISRRHPIRAYHNAVQGWAGGISSIEDNPRFLPDDSLYRILPNSPCLGAGVASVTINSETVETPQWDFRGVGRKSAKGDSPDLGAVESPWDGGTGAEPDHQSLQDDHEKHLKLSIQFNQRSPSEFSGDSAYVLRAGKITMTIIVNDELPAIPAPLTGLAFVLAPGDNLLEVEVSGRGRDGVKPLAVSFGLEGRDEVLNRVTDDLDLDYHNYSGLFPGTYRLQFLPSDENRFFDHANEASITITVLPYWYTRWWAYTLYALCVVSIALGILRSRVKRLTLQQQLALKHLQAEKLSEIDKMKSRFFANVSHEFRTPLSLILGPADQLEASERDARRKEQLRLVRRNAERLLTMVNQLLQFARVEAGTMTLRVSLQPVPPLLKRIVSSFATAAVKKGVALGIAIEPPAFEGYVDAEKLTHIVENLLSNAIKYTGTGGRVELSARRIAAELTITVRDTGIGISAEHLPHLFDRFYRVDGSHHAEGTGIGLSLAKEMAELHHGSISLASTPAVGTIATLTIPISGYAESDITPNEEAKQPSPSRAGTVEGSAVEHPSEQNGQRDLVLIVEDNDDARAYLRSRLAAEFDVVEATDGKDAVQRAQERIPDIVVSDVMMPGINGYELCRMLKTDVRTSHIPVILLTALADRSDRIEGLETGADDYLVKPFDAQELLIRSRNLIANRKIIQEKFRVAAVVTPAEARVESLDETFLRTTLETVLTRIGSQKFDVDELASAVFLSRAQLYRKLRALTGLSPSDFIRHARLQKAKELLERKAGTIAEIADRVGFSNHSYFSKCFQELFGVLPSDVR